MGQFMGLYWGFGGNLCESADVVVGMNPTVHKFFIGNLDE